MFESIAHNLKAVASACVRLNRGTEIDLTHKPKNRVDVSIFRVETGKWEHLAPSFNSRINAGANWMATIMGSAAGTPANYIALTATLVTAATGDTTLAGEITTNGLARAQGTYGTYTAPGSVGGAASYRLTKTFTYTGTGAVTVQTAALFDAAAAGNMFVETQLTASATVTANGDQIAITWTVNI